MRLQGKTWLLPKMPCQVDFCMELSPRCVLPKPCLVLRQHCRQRRASLQTGLLSSNTAGNLGPASHTWHCRTAASLYVQEQQC